MRRLAGTERRPPTRSYHVPNVQMDLLQGTVPAASISLSPKIVDDLFLRRCHTTVRIRKLRKQPTVGPALPNIRTIYPNRLRAALPVIASTEQAVILRGNAFEAALVFEMHRDGSVLAAYGDANTDHAEKWT